MGGLLLDTGHQLASCLEVFADKDVRGEVDHVLLAATIRHPDQGLEVVEGIPHDVAYKYAMVSSKGAYQFLKINLRHFLRHFKTNFSRI